MCRGDGKFKVGVVYNDANINGGLLPDSKSMSVSVLCSITPVNGGVPRDYGNINVGLLRAGFASDAAPKPPITGWTTSGLA
jgi:hypothetical protein